MPSHEYSPYSSSTLKNSTSASWNLASRAESGNKKDDDLISIHSSSSECEFAHGGNSLVLNDQRSSLQKKRQREGGDDDDDSFYSLASSSDEDGDYIPSPARKNRARGGRENNTKNNALVYKSTVPAAPKKKAPYGFARIMDKLSNRTEAAAAFDSNKSGVRADFYSSSRNAHDVLLSSVGQYSCVSVGNGGPYFGLSKLRVSGNQGGASIAFMSTAQKRAERKQSHKRTPRYDVTSDPKYARLQGWVERFNRENGTDFVVNGIRPEEMEAEVEKAVYCNSCNNNVTWSVGLSDPFIKKCSKVELNMQHPLVKHKDCCGKKCPHCNATVEEFILKDGSDNKFRKHVIHCQKWHLMFDKLVELQRKKGTWRVPHTDKSLTKTEVSAARWKDTQRIEKNGPLDEYQKGKLEATFPGILKK